MDNQDNLITNKLKWRFDASTFKLLGRGLISDRITAIYELVKNCYDANATVVDLEFYDIDTRNPKSTIIIRDDGHGMSLDDIKNKWLVVGTSSKRKNLFSAPPFNRRYIGEKGVGRFATDKLGEHLRIRTKQEKDNRILEVTINWKEYERLTSKDIQQVLFTDLENEYKFIEDNQIFKKGQGTELCITMPHEAWDKEMLLRLHNQLTRILSPIHQLTPPFNINFYAPTFGLKYENIEPEPIETLATVHTIIPFQEGKQGILVFDEIKQEFEIEYVEAEIFGLVRIELYYFNSDAQKLFKSKYKNTENHIEGVKIYRDGVICTPFAEYEVTVDKRRDILGIDKRRYVEAFDRLSSREVIGLVSITNSGNPNIVDATNRQDFIDNEAYRRLKEFIIEQLDVLVKYKFVKRKENKVIIQNNLKKASANVKGMATGLKKIVRDNPELGKLLGPTIAQAEQAANYVNEGIKDKEEDKKEFIQKENLYLSLMSLQDFANDLAHGIRFALTPAKHSAEFLMRNYPNPNYEKLFSKYAKTIFGQTEKISQLVDFMLSYSQTDIEDSTFSVQALLSDILRGAYTILFETEKIDIQIDIATNIELTGNRKFIEDVLSNLISNSVKALKETTHKIIKCESYIDNNNLCILFSDNGHGVDEKIKPRIFEMFKTTTAEQGGAGLGLYIAQKRMEALNGRIELFQSVFSPIGATFKLSLPLNKFKK
jgi:signal transduction histidine kinase